MDKKLHIIAAPGAGKTTLGIEVISRLNSNTLILSPTNTIKNQWKDRICSSFIEEKDYDKISTDIRNPKIITIITYQALLAAFCGRVEPDDAELVDVDIDSSSEENEVQDSLLSSKRFKPEKAQEIIQILKDAKISVLCFDEAHHLRKEWWKALTYLVEELKPRQTLSLTATPPYDVDAQEWERYQNLCGEIDEVISIPELVKNGDLCPHQDFIYISGLRDSEKELIRRHSANVAEMIKIIISDTELHNYLKRQNFVVAPNSELEKIYDDPDFYVSVVSLLNRIGISPSKEFLSLFNAKLYEMPKFDITQGKNFLQGLLFDHEEEFVEIPEKIEEYKNQVKRLGLVNNKKILLNDSLKVQKQIASSLGKLDSISDIVGIEFGELKDDLRMVILADFIRADDTETNHLGVVPIWRTLKNKYKKELSLGVLCGTLIYIPKCKESEFVNLLESNDLSLKNINISEVSEDSDYIKIVPNENAKQKIVSVITQMFNQGLITVLVGTQALLGEGWDAPSINSLILSSTVSSYMLSNQMRGRAIRIDKSNVNKISNIWHLASVAIPSGNSGLFQKVETSLELADKNDALWYDINQLSKRFEGFEAPSFWGKHEITNGLDRVFRWNTFNYLIEQNGEKAFKVLNDATVRNAKNRFQTLQWWKDALHLGYNAPQMSMASGVESEKLTVRTLRYTSYKEIIESIFWTFVSVGMCVPISDSVGLSLWGVLIIALIISLSVVLFKFLKTGTISGVMKQIAIVHLEMLSYSGYIKTSLKRVGLRVETDDAVYVSCSNLSTEENNLFIKTLQEFLNPIDNPRYIMIKQNKFLGIVRQEDYFAIPALFSSNKKEVDLFEKLWNKYIGNCSIVYTRNNEGRKVLLKARKEAFSSTKRPKTKRLSKWR